MIQYYTRTSYVASWASYMTSGLAPLSSLLEPHTVVPGTYCTVLSHETMPEHSVIVLQRSLASAIHEIDTAR